jgi:long-subunit fatty acid transport protein
VRASPIPSGNVEPGFPRANAYVASIGFSYTLQSRHISFEAGGAYYFFQRNNVSGQEAPFNPGAPGSYTGDDRVWSGSVHWRF